MGTLALFCSVWLFYVKMETIRKKLEGLKARLAQAEQEAKEAENELAATNQKADEHEQEVSTILDEINTLEDQLDSTESKMYNTESNLHLSGKKLDEIQRAKGVLISRSETEQELHDRLSAELDALTEQNNDIEEKLKEVNSEIDELEQAYDTEEERATNADNRVKSLEIEVLQVGNNLRTMEISQYQSNQRDSEHNSQITELTTKLQSVSEKAEKFEALLGELEKNQEELEGKLQEEKDKYNNTKRDMDLILAEIQEMNI